METSWEACPLLAPRICFHKLPDCIACTNKLEVINTLTIRHHLHYYHQGCWWRSNSPTFNINGRGYGNEMKEKTKRQQTLGMKWYPFSALNKRCINSVVLLPILARSSTLQIKEKWSIQLPKLKKQLQESWEMAPTKGRRASLAQPSRPPMAWILVRITQKATVVNHRARWQNTSLASVFHQYFQNKLSAASSLAWRTGSLPKDPHLYQFRIDTF